MSSRSIEELDPNFRSSTAAEACVLEVDAFDASRVALRGLAWLEENRASRSFRRLPDRAEGPLSEGVSVLSYCPSSAFVSFRTDSSSIGVRVVNEDTSLMQHMAASGSAGLELYLKDGPRWLPVATAIPEANVAIYERSLLSGMPRLSREFRLYLPLYKRLNELTLRFDSDATVTPVPAPAGEKPIFIYGTSITQGGCASTAGSDYVSHLGRLLDAEVINFGFSGNGRGEPEVAELIAEVDAEMFVLDFGPNSGVDTLGERLPRFVEILREKRPGIPIVLITMPCYNGTLVSIDRFRTGRALRDIMLSFYCRQREAGDEDIHLIDGFGISPAGEAGTYVDGVHPTTLGFVQMAERMAPQLAAIRLWQRQWVGRA